MSLIVNRLKALHKQLMAAHVGSCGMATAATGREREDFIDIFLRNSVPPAFRFGSGQMVDSGQRESRQLDIVIESPFSPSIPLLGSSIVRLYPVESVSTVIEVKSDLTKQWAEVVENFDSVNALQGGGGGSTGFVEPRLRQEEIAYCAVGFLGWQNKQTTIDHWENSNNQLDIVLQLEPLRIVHKHASSDVADCIDGELALLRFLELLGRSLTRSTSAVRDMSRYYL